MSLRRVQAATAELRDAVDRLRFGAPVSHVYNPLDYARRSHAAYLRRFAATPARVLFLGMNPGPWGMAQTGIPFGEVALVRDWMGIEARVDRPQREHPRRPIEGFACTRSEVSGARLWGAIKQQWKSPEAFFDRHFVGNYCPLVFMEDGGRNRTPEKLPAFEREPLFAHCDRSLQRLVRALEVEWVVGIGAFAERRAREALLEFDLEIGVVLHPSPANPRANRGWEREARQQLVALGLCR